MAFNPETATYETGIYQWEQTDPVQGGVGGIDNVPMVQLGNRTAYLKEHVDALENDSTGYRTIKTITANTTLTAADYGALIVIGAAAGATVVVTLPGSGASVTGKSLSFVNKSAQLVTLTKAGSDTLEGGATFDLPSAGDEAEISLDKPNTNFVIKRSKLVQGAKNRTKATPVDLTTNSGSFVDLPLATYTAPSDGVTRYFLVIAKSDVSFSGSAGDGGKLRVVNDGVQQVISEPYLDVLSSNVDLIFSAAVAIDYITVLPGKTVKAQVMSTSGGNVDFKNNKFLMLEQ